MNKNKGIFFFFIISHIFINAQENTSFFNVNLHKISVNPIISEKYGPFNKYFKNYQNSIGFGIRYGHYYAKNLAINPSLEMHFLKNNKTHLNAKKFDFVVYNNFTALRIKEIFQMNVNTGVGYSLYTINNNKQESYYFKYTYKGTLINVEIESDFKCNDKLFFKIGIINSYFKIFNSKYLEKENLSTNNIFIDFNLGFKYKISVY